MKKHILVTLFIFVTGIFSFAEGNSVPAGASFHKENACIVEKSSISEKVKDNIRIINQSSDSDLKITVYMLNPKNNEWVCYGTGFVKGFGDTDFIESLTNMKISKAEKFAVYAENGKSYDYVFVERHNDLYIFVK